MSAVEAGQAPRDDALPILPPALRLAGKRVVVTGAAEGVGRATAQVLASLGADLVVSDRNSLADLKASLPASTRVDMVQADMGEPGFAESLFAFGPVYGLAHCAAVFYPGAVGRDELLARIGKVLDLNVRVPLELGLYAIEHMRANGGGRIVLIGSVGGRNGGVAAAAPADYVASKGALHTLMRNLSRHGVGEDVLVNAVAPGPTRTAMTKDVTYAEGGLPRGRMAEPEEIAWPIAFLLTPAAANVSGAVFDVNGGTFVG